MDFFAITAFGFIGGVVFTLSVMLPAPDIKQQAIDRGYAIHCPQDGKFAWNGECGQ